jgi:hypothetical protein
VRRAAHERHGEPFLDQDRANVAPVGLQRAAVPAVVAEPRALLPRGAGALDVLEVEVTGADQLEEALRGPHSELTLRFAGDTINVFHVQPNVRLVGFNAPESSNAACPAQLLGDPSFSVLRYLAWPFIRITQKAGRWEAQQATSKPEMRLR